MKFLGGASAWAVDHWPGLSGMFLAAGALYAWLRAFLSGKQEKEARLAAAREIAERELARITQHVAAEGQRLLDIRGAQISDNVIQLAELKSKVAALEQLYGRAVVSLQEANAENERLKREIRAYEEREAQFREQLHDAQAAIKSLQGRVKELENGSGSHRAEQ
jgi:chromosome segregation ATPase